MEKLALAGGKAGTVPFRWSSRVADWSGTVFLWLQLWHVVQNYYIQLNAGRITLWVYYEQGTSICIIKL